MNRCFSPLFLLPLITLLPLPFGSPVKLVSYWAAYRAEGIPVKLAAVDSSVDIVAVSFAKPSTNATEIMNDPDLQANLDKPSIAALQAKGTKVILSVGGWSYKPLFKEPIEQNGDGFAAAIAQVVQSYNFDGVDLDIEDDKIDQGKVGSFMQKLRTMLPAGQKTLSLCIQPTLGSAFAGYAQQSKDSIDYLFLMGYDMGRRWGAVGSQDVQAFAGATGIPSAKMVLGLMPGKDDGKEVCTSAADAVAVAQKAGQNQPPLYGIGTWNIQRDLAKENTLVDGPLEKFLKQALEGTQTPAGLPTSCGAGPPPPPPPHHGAGSCDKASSSNACGACNVELDCGNDGSDPKVVHCFKVPDPKCGPAPGPGPAPAPTPAPPGPAPGPAPGPSTNGWCVKASPQNKCLGCTLGQTGTCGGVEYCQGLKDPNCGQWLLPGFLGPIVV